MRINWFSPLPPAQTDIAHYTMRILPELSSSADVVLWTDQTVWDRALEHHAVVNHYDADEIKSDLFRHADVNIYHIGNNVEFHGHIWEASKLNPGIVVLHDQSVHEFVAQYFINRQGGRDEYCSLVEQYYGRNGVQAVRDFEKGLLSMDYIAEYYPMDDYVLEHSRGVFVHTRNGFEVLSEKKKWPVGYAPLPYRASTVLSENRNKKCAVGPPYRLIIFGYLGSNRRVNSVLQALDALPDKKKFHLDIYGQVFDLRGLKERIRTLGLEKLVKVHGYVPEQELDSALDEAHLAINLRLPSRGEASGTQLRIWDHALPSLVTRTKWYATLPEEAVRFVSPGADEIWDIKVLLEDFLTNREAYSAMGKAGRRILEEQHRPSSYVDSLAAFCRAVAEGRDERLHSYFVKRVADEMALWEESQGELRHRRNVAAEIHELLA